MPSPNSGIRRRRAACQHSGALPAHAVSTRPLEETFLLSLPVEPVSCQNWFRHLRRAGSRDGLRALAGPTDDSGAAASARDTDAHDRSAAPDTGGPALADRAAELLGRTGPARFRATRIRPRRVGVLGGAMAAVTRGDRRLYLVRS